MRAAWLILICLAATGLALCVSALSEDANSHQGRDFLLRGIYAYSAVILIAAFSFWRQLGPTVFCSLLAVTASVTFVFSGVNPVAQLFAAVAVGFVTGLAIEFFAKHQAKQRI